MGSSDVIVSTVNLNGIPRGDQTAVCREPRPAALAREYHRRRRVPAGNPRRRRSVPHATAALAAWAASAKVERAAADALRWSDHAPVTVEYSG
jgi:hypothetical protein